MFDPYQEWLGIGKDERPITLYRLLGVSPKETDLNAIKQAAEAQAFVVSRHRKGENGDLATRLFREIEKAKTTLLDPALRKAYDSRRRQGGAANSAVVAEVEEIVELDAVEEDDLRANGSRRSSTTRSRRRSEYDDEPVAKGKSTWLWIVLASAAAIVVLAAGGIAAAIYLSNKKEPEKGPPIVAQAQNPPPAPVKDPPKAEPPKAEPPKADPPKAEPPKTEPPPAKPPETTPPAPAPAPPPPAPKPPAPKPPAPTMAKQPVPDSMAQARAEAALKEKFKTEYTRTRPEDVLALAAKFMQPGREDRNDPAAWFVLLREARDLALQANRPRLAIEAINEIDRWFIVDALDMKIKALTQIGTSNNEFTVASMVRTCLNLVQQAYAEEKYDAARRFISIAETALKEVKSGKLIDMVRDQKSEVEVNAIEFEKVTQARAKMMQSPDDPEANLTVGQYLAFFQADWDKGLPMLAKSSDAALKKQAMQDLSQPVDAKEQLAIADAWWNWGIAQKERSQRHLIKRAKMWYERAGPNTQGKDRTQVITRIQDAQQKEYARILRLFPGSYYGRDTESRVLLLREGGGNMKSEEAVEKGLEWLAKHQSSDGHWSTNGFHLVNKCTCSEHTKTDQKHDIAGTAFGLMPFLGAGETHKSGKYQGVVRRGLQYLVEEQRKKLPAGNFHDNAYENALASIAVIEAYGMTKDPTLRASALAAAAYILRAQDSGGSWGYSSGTKGDTSVSGWQFTALKAAAYAKFDVPADAFVRLSQFLDTVAEPGGLGYGYNSPGNGVSTSAVGILCREFLSWGPGHPALAKEADFLLRPENFPTKDKISMYSVFYITQVAHHLGGHHWEKWNGSVRDLLIDLQDKGDDPKHKHQAGSWSPRADPYAAQGGRLMFTSLSLIALEAYYYHIPLYGYGPSVFD